MDNQSNLLAKKLLQNKIVFGYVFLLLVIIYVFSVSIIAQDGRLIPEENVKRKYEMDINRDMKIELLFQIEASINPKFSEYIRYAESDMIRSTNSNKWKICLQVKNFAKSI